MVASMYCWGYHHKTPDADRLKQQKFASLQFCSWEPNTKVSAGLGPPEAALLGLQKATFMLSSEGAISIHS